MRPTSPSDHRRSLRFGLIGAIALSAILTGPALAAASPATVTRATLASSFVDLEGNFFPATCDETQVIRGDLRREMFHCTFDDAVPAPYVCDETCSWSSDFDGAPATGTHFVVTASGMRGWAVY
jgi:hypothetical protein